MKARRQSAVRRPDGRGSVSHRSGDSHGDAPGAGNAAQTTPAPTATKQAPATASNAAIVDPVEARSSDLHAKLRITPAQEDLWTNLTQVMRDNAKTMEPLRKARAEKAISQPMRRLPKYMLPASRSSSQSSRRSMTACRIRRRRMPIPYSAETRRRRPRRQRANDRKYAPCQDKTPTVRDGVALRKGESR
jgi:hypothetical protein